MRRIEEVYDDIAADIRLTSLQSALEEARAARGGMMTPQGEGEEEGEGIVYEGDQPIFQDTYNGDEADFVGEDAQYGVGLGVGV